MTEQLKNLAEEMITEIRDLKDLTKEQLPILAQEYVRYNIYASTILLVIGVLGVLISVGLFIYAANTPTQAYHDDFTGKAISAIIFGLVIGVISIVSCICSIDNLLSFILQPRRMAIEAITSLLRNK